MTDLLILFLTGMYLTDLTYIDTIHPNTGGLDDARTRKVQSNAKQVSMKNWTFSSTNTDVMNLRAWDINQPRSLFVLLCQIH